MSNENIFKAAAIANAKAAQETQVKQYGNLPNHLNPIFLKIKNKLTELDNKWPTANIKQNRAADLVVGTVIGNSLTIPGSESTAHSYAKQYIKPEMKVLCETVNEFRLINIDNALLIATQVWFTRSHIAYRGFNTKMSLEVLEDNPELPKCITELLDDDSIEDVIKDVLNG